MSVVPQGAFAAKKVRQNEEKLQNHRHSDYNMDLSPTNYNGKFMNSIWGMYNRYSVHNFKKNIDDNKNVIAFGGLQTKESDAASVSAEKNSADSKGSNKTSLQVSTPSMWAFS